MRENVKCVYVLCVCVYKRTDYIFEKNYFRVEKGGRCKSKEEKKGASKTNKNEQKRKREKPTETEKKKESYSYLRRDFFLRGGCVRVCKCVRE